MNRSRIASDSRRSPVHLPPHTPVHPFDQQYGTDTSGLWPGSRIAAGTGWPAEDLTAYYGIAPSILQAVLDLWLRAAKGHPRIEETVFLDIGAGKGRAIMLASQHPFLRVEGVELNADLAGIAEKNLQIWNTHPEAAALAPVSLHRADATGRPLPEEPTVAFLFHPFEDRLLRRFLRHASRSLRQTPRPFDLIYVNAEHGAMLDSNKGLRLLWKGHVPMSPADHAADREAIAQQEEYGSTGEELCSLYRMVVN